MEIYDENWYSSTGNEYRKHPRFQIFAFLRAVYIKLAFRPRTVLDVGCGMGNLVEMLHKLGIKTTGIEISDYALSQVPESLKDFFCRGDIINIPFKDGAFDVVVTVDVLEHIPSEYVPLAIKECARVARLGMYHEITVLEDKTVIHHPSHLSQCKASWWLSQFRAQLKGWEIKRGLRIPIFKNGILILRKSATKSGPKGAAFFFMHTAKSSWKPPADHPWRKPFIFNPARRYQVPSWV